MSSFKTSGGLADLTVNAGLRHDVQGQRIALVALHQARPPLGGACQLMAGQQLLAGAETFVKEKAERVAS